MHPDKLKSSSKSKIKSTSNSLHSQQLSTQKRTQAYNLIRRSYALLSTPNSRYTSTYRSLDARFWDGAKWVNVDFDVDDHDHVGVGDNKNPAQIDILLALLDANIPIKVNEREFIAAVGCRGWGLGKYGGEGGDVYRRKGIEEVGMRVRRFMEWVERRRKRNSGWVDARQEKERQNALHRLKEAVVKISKADMGAWSCWEWGLGRLNWMVGIDELMRRQFVYIVGDGSKDARGMYKGIRKGARRNEQNGTFLPDSQPMYGTEDEEIWAYERKPWFWRYDPIGKLRAEGERNFGVPDTPMFCTASWVNGVHYLVDNWLKTEWSDGIWEKVEALQYQGWGGMGIRKEKEQIKGKRNQIVERTWWFWDGCEGFSVDVELKGRGVGGVGSGWSGWSGWRQQNHESNPIGPYFALHGPYSERRSDTRSETLGSREDLFCQGDWMTMWMLMLVLIGWGGCMTVKWSWKRFLEQSLYGGERKRKIGRTSYLESSRKSSSEHYVDCVLYPTFRHPKTTYHENQHVMIHFP